MLLMSSQLQNQILIKLTKTNMLILQAPLLEHKILQPKEVQPNLKKEFKKILQ
jgi:hypothetical protein